MNMAKTFKYLLYLWLAYTVLFAFDVIPNTFSRSVSTILIIGFLYLGEKLEEIRRGY